MKKYFLTLVKLMALFALTSAFYGAWDGQGNLIGEILERVEYVEPEDIQIERKSWATVFPDFFRFIERDLEIKKITHFGPYYIIYACSDGKEYEIISKYIPDTTMPWNIVDTLRVNSKYDLIINEFTDPFVSALGQIQRYKPLDADTILGYGKLFWSPQLNGLLIDKSCKPPYYFFEDSIIMIGRQDPVLKTAQKRVYYYNCKPKKE